MPHQHRASRLGRRLATSASAAALCLAGAGVAAAPAQAAPDGSALVITEAYVRGGSTGAAYQQKFVEITNPTGAALALDGLSLQYVPSRGGLVSGTCALTGTLAAGASYVITVGSNGSAGEALTGDATCSRTNPAAGGGTLALVRGTDAHTFALGDTSADPEVVDLIGWGTGQSYETAAAGTTTTAQSLQRSGTADTNSNAADFTATVPTPGTAGSAPDPTPSESPTADPGSAVVPIAAIQGTGDATPLAGTTVTTRGVVTAVYADGGLSGYYIQTPGTGAAKAAGEASDGLFVYDGSGARSVDVGECYEISGTAGEYYGLTQLSKVTARTAVADCAPVTAVQVGEGAWPADDAAKEAYEGMILRPVGSWTVTDNYSTNQYGTIGLAVGDEPLYNATDQVAPGAEAAAYEKANQAREITLDDGSSWNFTTNTRAKSTPLPYLVADAPLRAGAAVTFTDDVVLDYRYGWNLQPRARVTGTTGSPISWDPSRPSAPQVAGDLSVASFNVLNYFTDLGADEAGCTAYTDRDGTPVTAKSCDVRGAYTAEALAQQEAKIVAAINALDASVVGLEEIENSAKFGHDRDATLAHLVDALNAAAGEQRWAYVPSPEERPDLADEDVIRTAFIYQPALVETVGESVILDDAAFTGTARQPLAQAFRRVGVAGGPFVVVTNHFKSKGSVLPGEGNADSGDGQGANNAQRVLQAQALTDFAAQWSDRPVLLIGDFNSYSHEDPITTLEGAGYTLVHDLVDGVGYSYQFDGRIGSLDHVLLNDAAASLVSGAKVWDINADESIALEYSRTNYNVTQLYAADAYRSSDHDPVKVGLSIPAAEMPAAVAAASASGAGEVLIGDWDGDGWVTYALRMRDTVTFYGENAADAQPWAVVTLGKVNHAATVGDWDGDGDDELALSKGKNVFRQVSADSEVLVKAI